MIISFLSRRALLAAGILVTVVTTSSRAASTEILSCMEEIENYCKVVQPGAGRIIQCLDVQGKELTPVCREKVDKALARFEEAKNICAEDIRKYCSEVKPGEGRVLKCMKAQKELISPACRKEVAIWGGGDDPRKTVTGNEQKK
jgi:Cysteine rich repeat